MPGSRTPQLRVLTATVAGHAIAIPAQAVAGVQVCPLAPPPPGAPPWLGGLALAGGTVALAVAPFHAAGPLPPRRDATLVMAATAGPAWGLVVEAVGGIDLVDPLPASTVPIGACPPRWLRPCRSDDGRLCAAIDPEAIATALAGLAAEVA